MRRIQFMVPVLLFVLAVFGVSAQELADDFSRDFRAADDSVKMQILESSLEYDAAELEDFYNEVLDYIINNSSGRIRDAASRQTYEIAVSRLVEIGSNRPALRIWELFQLDQETSQRIKLLEAMEVLGDGSERLYLRLNDWIVTQNNLVRSGEDIDTQVLGAAVDTAAALNDTVFVDAMLHTITYSHPSRIDNAAREAVQAYGDQQMQLFAEYIPAQNQAFQIELMGYIQDRDDLALNERAELARVVLRDALGMQLSTSAESDRNRRLRIIAAELIRDAEYAEASAEAVGHFNSMASDYEDRRITQLQMLDAIHTLGSVGSQEAAVRLTRYLEYLNTQTQNDRPVSTQLMLSTVNTLGELGYAEAYNALFYATMLNYSSRVQDALQDAIEAVRE